MGPISDAGRQKCGAATRLRWARYRAAKALAAAGGGPLPVLKSGPVSTVPGGPLPGVVPDPADTHAVAQARYHEGIVKGDARFVLEEIKRGDRGDSGSGVALDPLYVSIQGLSRDSRDKLVRALVSRLLPVLIDGGLPVEEAG